ncbi:MAG: hypothetical protein NVV59_08015 [Chitinophagaceae bacterium]|nr:hypothetical protein [Chitinophagaceae bacterium]
MKTFVKETHYVSEQELMEYNAFLQFAPRSFFCANLNAHRL